MFRLNIFKSVLRLCLPISCLKFYPQSLVEREILKYLEHYIEISVSQPVTRTINTSTGWPSWITETLSDPPTQLIYIPRGRIYFEYIAGSLWDAQLVKLKLNYKCEESTLSKMNDVNSFDTEYLVCCVGFKQKHYMYIISYDKVHY